MSASLRRGVARRASAVRPRRTDGYVYPAREDSALLAAAARAGPGRRVLEIGVGSGVAALVAARSGAAPVVVTDRNPHALRRVRARARAEGLPIAPVRTDLARGLGRFDRVLANPPYLPTRPGERDPDPLVNLALDGGPDGCRVLARILRDLPTHLAEGGRAYVVVSSLQAAKRRRRLAAGWRRGGGRLAVVDTRRFEGERLWLWELTVRRRPPAGGRTRRSARGTRGRRRSRPASRSGSSPVPAPGRTTAPGAASGRRRSRPGS